MALVFRNLLFMFLDMGQQLSKFIGSHSSEYFGDLVPEWHFKLEFFLRIELEKAFRERVQVMASFSAKLLCRERLQDTTFKEEFK